MSTSQSVSAVTCALVHESARADVFELSRHQGFIVAKLALSFAALAVAPFFLVLQGAPTPAEALVFAFGLVPLAAAVVVARTGSIGVGHAIVFSCLIGLSLTFLVGLRTGPGCALAWLFAAQVEATLPRERLLVRLGTLIVTAVLGGITVAAFWWNSAVSTASGTCAIIAGLALVYGAVLCRDLRRQRAAADQSAGKSDRLLQTLLAATESVLVRFNVGGTTICTDAQATAFGLGSSEISDRGLFDRLHVADRVTFLKAVADATERERTIAICVRLRVDGAAKGSKPSDARHLWIEMRMTRAPLGTGQGDVIAVLRDMSEWRTPAGMPSEADLLSRESVLTTLSRELRTPLNAIIGFSEMLASHSLRPANLANQREYAHIIHDSSRHLLSLVDSIVQMTKVHSGQFTLDPKRFEPGPVVERCCDMVRFEAKRGGVSVRCEQLTTPTTIIGDERAFTQITTNLLTNAVKFTPPTGQVTIGLRQEDASLLLTVRDTGVGICAEDLKRLGEPFFKSRRESETGSRGMGLGLSVVRGLVGLHRGTINIESESGKGTRVVVRLPLDCRGTVQTPTAKIECLATRTIDGRNQQPFDVRMKQIA